MLYIYIYIYLSISICISVCLSIFFLGCLWLSFRLSLSFFLAVLNSGYFLHQNSTKGFLCCPINLASWLHELFLKACNNKTKASVQEWFQHCAFCPDCHSFTCFIVIIRLNLPCEEDAEGQIFSYQQYCCGKSCKCYWVRTFNRKLSFIESNWTAVHGDHWICSGRTLPVQMLLLSVCPLVCKWDMFPNGNCSDNDLNGYSMILMGPFQLEIFYDSVLSQTVFVLNLYTLSNFKLMCMFFVTTSENFFSCQHFH